MVEGGLSGGRGCGPALPFERDVDRGHVLLEERSKGGRKIGIVGYECKEGVGVDPIGGSGGKPGRRGAHMGGRSGWIGVGDSRWIKSSEGVVGVRRGGGFVSAGGRCGVVHGGGGGKGGEVERELCCFGGNDRSADENFGSPGGVGVVVYSPVKLRNNLFDYTWELV